jgi:hypothetical protein
VEVDLAHPIFAQVVKNLARAVFRRVVYDDQLFADIAQIYSLDAPDDLVDGARLVINRHQDGQKWRILHFAQLYLLELIQGIVIDSRLQSIA